MNAQKRTTTTAQHAPASLQFSMINLILLIAALVIITVGFTTLAHGSTALAPLLLILGYAVLIPLAIIL